VPCPKLPQACHAPYRPVQPARNFHSFVQASALTTTFARRWFRACGCRLLEDRKSLLLASRGRICLAGGRFHSATPNDSGDEFHCRAPRVPANPSDKRQHKDRKQQSKRLHLWTSTIPGTAASSVLDWSSSLPVKAHRTPLAVPSKWGPSQAIPEPGGRSLSIRSTPQARNQTRCHCSADGNRTG